ncbi:SDR family oxidoreductase [Paraburkholderia flava]|uniref:SDR family oxidoreductase n=1 Tax=Paraburkholderia flava TaxID=2547393 RepID=UPI00105C02A0|nr:SDR family oxidoreductase [Paraburkholderia flava]
MNRPVALVTGAAKRAGRDFACYFAEKGYDVVVHYHGSENEAREVVDEAVRQGARAIAVRADLREAVDIDNLIDVTYREFQRLDLLVNNASVFAQEHFPDFSLKLLDDAWTVNCRAPILLIQAFYRKAAAAGATGTVVNVVDQKIRDNFHKDHFSYTVGKVAIGNLTKMLAISAQPVLRVNAVFPGLMLPSDNQTQRDFEYASTRSNLIGRAVGPRDVAEAIQMLTLPSMVGVDFVVDGGQNLIPVDQDVLYLHRAPADGESGR